MIKTIFTYSLGLFSIILTVTQTCEDLPKYDYESHPNQPFEFKHADIRVTLEPEINLIRGVVTYSVLPKVDGFTQLILQTEESAIDDITINEIETDFVVSGDSLIIELQDSSIPGEKLNVAITWQSNSSFGLYKDFESNFWSSKNPLAHRHWLPGFDHPRNELTFDAYFTIPYNTEIMFNGELVGQAAKPANKKEIHYQSETAVPFTGLGFAMGDFIISEVTSGLSSVRLFSAEGMYSEEDRTTLIREASQLKKDIEKTLSMEYPWEALNIIVLPDNFWEERTHGAGTIFLYENLGSLSNQLKRGMYAQWFGEYHRPEQFFEGDEQIKAALHYSLVNESALIDNPDSLLFVDGWNAWQSGFQNESELFKTTVKNSLPELVRTMSGIVEYEDYAEFWYHETGINWFDITFDESDKSSNGSVEALTYSLDTEYDEVTSNLNLIFELKKGKGEELYSLSMMEYTFDDSISHEVNFTGELDTVSIELSPSIEFISFSEGSISLDEISFGDFPLFFLLNQLRSKKVDDRLIAARLLVNFSENPDLQLALNDVMAAEQEPTVKAALLSTMATITNGATGTEQQFLTGLNNTSLEIQSASISALKNYPENEMVKSSLRSKVLRTDSEQIFNKALITYGRLVQDDEVVSLAQRLVRVDSTGMKTLSVMTQFFSADSNETFINLAEEFLLDSYSYETRKEALNYLKNNDVDADRWTIRIKELLEDRDPRIRYESLSAVKKLPPSDALLILGLVEQNEFDIRVLLEADNWLEEISE
ncbi:MAG: hypothetical protein BalsKO_09450 [Balneolaceae bacterium]